MQLFRISKTLLYSHETYYNMKNIRIVKENNNKSFVGLNQ